MLGYYKDPKKTAEVMTENFFHTGDIGEVDSEGFLKITDRKKEMFKTSGGKYIAPQVIENQMKQSLFIEQIMVVGENRKMPTALIQPNIEYVKQWLESKGIKTNSLEESFKESTLIQAIQNDIEEHNKNFGSWEQIKKFKLVPEEWTIEGGHLTLLKRCILKYIFSILIFEVFSLLSTFFLIKLFYYACIVKFTIFVFYET